MTFYRVKWFDGIEGWRVRWALCKRDAIAIVHDVYQTAGTRRLMGEPKIDEMEIAPGTTALVDWLNLHYVSDNV